MAICNQCGRKYRMNWVRMQPCPTCRQTEGRLNRESTLRQINEIINRVNERGHQMRVLNGGARVTATFELPPSIDITKFIGWLHTEVSMGNDYTVAEGINQPVRIVDPVQVQVFGNPEDGQ